MPGTRSLSFAARVRTTSLGSNCSRSLGPPLPTRHANSCAPFPISSNGWLGSPVWTTKPTSPVSSTPHRAIAVVFLRGAHHLLLCADEEKKKALVDKVWQAMWRFNHTYTVNTAKGDQMTMWCTCPPPPDATVLALTLNSLISPWSRLVMNIRCDGRSWLLDHPQRRAQFHGQAHLLALRR